MFPHEIWSKIVLSCNPRTCNTLRKICHSIRYILHKQYPKYEATSTTVKLVKREKPLNDKIVINCMTNGCINGYPDQVASILKDFTIQPYEEFIDIALKKGHFECARAILQDMEKVNPTFLCRAVVHDNAECVEFLLNNLKVDPNQEIYSQADYHTDPHMEFLLHRAVRNKAVGIIQQLVNANADRTVKDSDKLTPEDVAKSLLAREDPQHQKTSEYQEIIKILRRNINS